MASNSRGKKIAFLATDGFNQAELMEPRKALEGAGAHIEVVSPSSGISILLAQLKMTCPSTAIL
jgi:protease I